MKSADHKRWSLSLAAALALHLAAITVVGWLWSPRPVPRDTPAVEHDVQVVMVPPARPAVRPLVVAPRRARVQVARPAPRRTHQSRRRAPARSRPPARSSSSLNLEPVEPLSLRMRPLELSLSPDDPSARATGAPRGKKKAKVAARQLSEAEVVKGRIDGWLRDGKAATNARHGRGHPALFDLLRGADGNYRPTLAMIPARLDRARRDTYRAWQAAVKQFNKMPSALPYDSHATGEVVLPPKLLIGNDMINKAILKNATTLLRTEICLRAAPGQAPAVTSRKLSGVPRLDRLASAALTAAFPKKPFPADLPACTACYRFDVRFGRTLPTPYSACVFTGLFNNFKCLRQGKRFLLRKVSLVRIYFPRKVAGGKGK